MVLLSILVCRFLNKLTFHCLMSIAVMASLLSPALAQVEEADPPEITNGERLFLETRFAEFFANYLANGGNVNVPLPFQPPLEGDPVMDKVVNWRIPQGPLAIGPFKGQAMNCRQCHFVDELSEEADYGFRTYADFARRSPVPQREDAKETTVRNAPPLVNASLPRKNFFEHFDAEFASVAGLVAGTLTGRNFGWLPGERNQAIRHLVRIIKEDDGSGALAQKFGGLSYSVMITGTDPSILPEFLLPPEFRVDVATATDQQIFQGVAKLIAAYTADLVFSQDENGNFNASPYDVFLEMNHLPHQPKHGQTDLQYSRLLLKKIRFLEFVGKLQFVTSGEFELDPDLPFRFGPDQLKGLKIFFEEGNSFFHDYRKSGRKSVGNCIACHAAPNFTDFELHNTGVAQTEYDIIHGSGQFAKLRIPGLIKRNLNPNEYLPATEQHPNGKEPFRSIPTAENPQLTDLGVWNILFNPDFPKPQSRIFRVLCKNQIKNHSGYCRPRDLLNKSIAVFKTAGLRDLVDSAPYFHNGQLDTFEEVIEAYIKSAELAREGKLRNADPELLQISLTRDDIPFLVSFLSALTEDYD